MTAFAWVVRLKSRAEFVDLREVHSRHAADAEVAAQDVAAELPADPLIDRSVFEVRRARSAHGGTPFCGVSGIVPGRTSH